MLKKLVIAAVALFAGLTVLSFSQGGRAILSSLGNRFGEFCCSAKNKLVTPEDQLKQLNKEIANIDKDIKKNIGRVSEMEEQVNKFDKQVKAQRAHLGELKDKMLVMQKSLQDGERQVSKGESRELTRKLDRATNEYTCLKEKNKIHEKVLEEKRKALEAARNRLSKMVDEKDKLTVLSARLAGHLEAVKVKQTGTPVEFDDSSVARCHELAQEIESRLNKAEIEAKYLKQYGYVTSSDLDEGKSREEVLKATKAALQEDNDQEALLDKNEK